MIRHLNLFLLLAWSCVVCQAQDTPSKRDQINRLGGVSLTGGTMVSGDDLQVNDGGGKATSSTVTVTGRKFDTAVQIDITQSPENTWDVSARFPITGTVAKGDWIVAHFFLRGEASDGQSGGVGEFVFETYGPPYTKSVQYLAES